jgi:hypothetical protein
MQYNCSLFVGRDGVVGIATRYGLDGPGIESSPSQWPSGLRRGSGATRLLRLRVRIHPGSWMFVSCVLCFKDKRQESGQDVKLKVQREKTQIPVGGEILRPRPDRPP